MNTVQRTGLTFVAAVIVAALALVANEVHSLSRDEAALADVYERQMDTILFSVNQHSWDVTDSWADEVERALRSERSPEQALRNLVESKVELAGVVLSADNRDGILVVTSDAGDDTSATVLDRDRLGALLRDARQETVPYTGTYRPLRAAGKVSTGDRFAQALAFTTETAGGVTVTALLLIDPERFVDEVVGIKLRSLERDQIGMRIRRSEAGETVLSVGNVSGGVAVSRPLWVFDDYEIGIALPGGSVSSIARRRSYRSLSLVGLLAVVIGVGTWVTYRTARRESDLARLKSDFVSNVSHELRTPLSLISMYAETLEMGRVTTEEKREQYYRIISAESNRLSHLVNNVLNFSRIEAGSKTYASDALDLGEIADRVNQAYRTQLERQGFRFDFEREPNPLPVRGDAAALEEAIINLVDNAVKYSTTQRHVTLRAGSDRQYVFVDVEDDGMGIHPADAQRVFDKFFRVESGLVRNTRGTGLGLSLVKHIVGAHEGTITLRSEPGKGSCFRISLPRHDGLESQARAVAGS